MARKFLVSLDLSKNELLNARLQNLSSDPSSPVAGQIYYNTSAKETRFYDGTQWIAGGATKYGPLSSRPAPSKGGILYVATDTQTLYVDNGTSWVQISVNPQDLEDAISTHNNNTTGVHGVNGDVVGTTDSQTLTNKVLGTSTSLGADLDADGYKIHFVGTPTSDGDAANKGYVDTELSAHNNSSSEVHGVTGNVVGTTDSQTLTNKTIADSLKFNDGGADSTIYADGNNLTVYANNDLYLNTNNGNINLQPDGEAQVYGDRIVTEDASQTLTNKTLGSGTVLSDALNANSNTVTNLPTPSNNSDAATKEYVDTQVSDSLITFYGTADEVDVTRIGNDVTIGLPDDVTVTGELTASSAHIGGNLQVDGNLNVTGSINAVNTTQVNISDNVINLNSDMPEDQAPSVDAGIKVHRGTENDVQLLWNETSDEWTLTNDGTHYHSVARKFAGNIGDGSALTYAVAHNLGTKDVTVQLFENSADYNQIEADVQHTSANTVTIKFASAPSLNEYRVVIVG
jgi:hypothetical protein